MHVRTKLQNGEDLEVLNITKTESRQLATAKRLLSQIHKHGSPMAAKSAKEACDAIEQTLTLVEKTDKSQEAAK